MIAAPGLEAKSLLEQLQEQYPGEHDDGQLRTLQRRVKCWRAGHGPEQEISFGQAHRPGEAAQTDFTWVTALGVTIAGEAFVHMLCVLVLPYSNWQWATVCLSESMMALRRGVQRALFQLGRVPRYHQTDNSTAATHRIPDEKRMILEGGKRPFNDDYVAVMRHFGMTRTIEVGAKEQNGDVEAGNRAVKSRLEQALLVRGSRDFPNVEDWQIFVDEVLRKANSKRGARVVEELAAMRELNVTKLAEFIEENVRVSDWSTIRIKHCAYSVPSRLIGERVKVRLFEENLEVTYAGVTQLACERLRGRNLHRIDYRHVIWSLVRKPGAFARYVYREEMFPSVVFRRAYDHISPEPSALRRRILIDRAGELVVGQERETGTARIHPAFAAFCNDWGIEGYVKRNAIVDLASSASLRWKLSSSSGGSRQIDAFHGTTHEAPADRFARDE